MSTLMAEIQTIVKKNNIEPPSRKIQYSTTISKETLMFLRHLCIIKKQSQSHKYSVSMIMREILDAYAEEILTDDFIDRWLGEINGERVFDLILDKAGPQQPQDFIKELVINHLL